MAAPAASGSRARTQSATIACKSVPLLLLPCLSKPPECMRTRPNRKGRISDDDKNIIIRFPVAEASTS